jgi:integrase
MWTARSTCSWPPKPTRPRVQLAGHQSRRTLLRLRSLLRPDPSPATGFRRPSGWPPAPPGPPATWSSPDRTALHYTRSTSVGCSTGHLQRAGRPGIRFHDLRHTHATLALQAGVHPKVVSERLGHATVVMTLDIYSHAIPALQQDAASIVAHLVGGTALAEEA